MPYIKDEDRQRIEGSLLNLPDLAAQITCVGELNYVITRLLVKILEREGMSYTNAQNWVSALEMAKLEFYRRCLAPYEDQKIAENGDVYPAKLDD